MKTNTKETVIIELDGVLNEWRGELDKNFIPPIKPTAKKFLEDLSKKYKIEISTKRDKELVKKWLINSKIYKFIEDITEE